MQRTSSTLGGILSDLGLQSALSMHRIRENWNSIFGKPMSLHSEPAGLKDGRLQIVVDSSAWLQQFNFHKINILSKLSKYGVTDVWFRMGRLGMSTPPKPGARINRAPNDAAILRRANGYINNITDVVDDEELSKCIKGAMRRWAASGRGGRFYDEAQQDEL